MPKKKGGKPVQCSKCNVEFSADDAMKKPGQLYVHKGKVLCEDCLVDMGVMPDSAEPFAVYMETITDMGKYGEGVGGV